MNDNQSDPFYVATSIPYVNGEPHLGHAMEFVLADVIARYHKQYQRDVFFSTGSDEHGGKVLETATAQGVAVEDFVAKNAQSFIDLAADLEVEYTKFIRTSDQQHEARAAVIWQTLANDIFKSTYSGMYDQKEESFLTHEEARELEKTNPKKFATLTKIEEENYFFKLSKYNTALIDLIKSDELLIFPKARKNEVLAFLEGGLQDISISRPADKIPWGIPVPGDEGHTMYVWFEALMNYITTLGYPDQPDFAKFWPMDVHVIGKDITRFHAVIWPAMLMGLGVKPPKALYVHGFINDASGEIMSKSKGNGVAPKEIYSIYGADAFRYYVTRHIPSGEDGNFSWERFETTYNNELGNDLGNLVQRTAAMIQRYQDGVIGDLPESMHDIAPYHDHFQAFRFDLALEYVWTLIRGLNQYIEEERPWQIAKEGDAEHLQEVLSYVVSSLLQIADLIYPVLPQTAASIITHFGDGMVHNEGGPMFPKIHNYTEAGKQAQK